MIESAGIAKQDRLSAFFAAFALSARLLPPGQTGTANLVVTAGPDGTAAQIAFHAQGTAVRPQMNDIGSSLLVAAAVEFGGTANPLINAMPDCFAVAVADLPVLQAVTEAFVAEAQGTRCGRHAALNRLCEVIVLLVLRQAIDRGTRGPGLLAGLSHPALHRAIVAIHEAPARSWRSEDLAAVSGMSRSRFMTTFRNTVGITPGAYVTAWRLTVGHRDLARGEQVKTVARRVGFGSAAAFSRAYARRFGRSPQATREDGRPAVQPYS